MYAFVDLVVHHGGGLGLDRVWSGVGFGEQDVGGPYHWVAIASTIRGGQELCKLLWVLEFTQKLT